MTIHACSIRNHCVLERQKITLVMGVTMMRDSRTNILAAASVCAFNPAVRAYLDAFANPVLAGKMGEIMRIKIVISTAQMDDDTNVHFRRSEVWSGEMEIQPEQEYLTKISIMGMGFNEPICEVPFSPMVGFYQWVPPLTDSDHLEMVEEKTKEAKDIYDVERRV